MAKTIAGLLTLSTLVFALGVLIALISGFNAVTAGKTGWGRVLAGAIPVLAIALLAVQFISNKRAGEASKAQSDEAQKKLINATLGSDACPKIMVDRMANQRPHGLSVFNANKEANIYDLVLYVQEGEHTADGQGFHTLQQQTVRFPTIPAGAGSTSIPFEFLSQRNISYLQFDLSTRRKICSGLIVLRGDGNGNWSAEAYPVHEGPLTAHKSEIPEAAQR
jgi:hypothetical protein